MSPTDDGAQPQGPDAAGGDPLAPQAAPDDSVLLTARGIRKSFGDNEVLRSIDLEVRRGEVVVLIGPSGSGKTTVLRSLNGLETPDGGTIAFAGGPELDFSGAIPKSGRFALRDRSAMVFQQHNLFPHMTVLQNVVEGPIRVQRVPKAQALAEASAAARAGRARREARRLPVRAVGRAAAARRHRARARAQARPAALRRADERARPRTRRGGAVGDQGARRRGLDDGRRHPRARLRAPGGRRGAVHGRRRRGGARCAAATSSRSRPRSGRAGSSTGSCGRSMKAPPRVRRWSSTARRCERIETSPGRKRPRYAAWASSTRRRWDVDDRDIRGASSGSDDERHDPRRRLRRAGVGERAVGAPRGRRRGDARRPDATAFVFGYSKLDILFGRRTLSRCAFVPRDQQARRGVPAGTRAEDRTGDATRHHRRRGVRPDAIVVALGADYDLAATPGFVEGGFEYYRSPVPSGFETSWRCSAVAGCCSPSSPSRQVPACAVRGHAAPPRPARRSRTPRRQRTPRGHPQPSPIPVSPGASAALEQAMAERGIAYTKRHRVYGIDPGARVAHFKDHDEPYDLFIGIPVHKVPDVLVEAGLTDDGWVKVDRRTLQTPFPGCTPSATAQRPASPRQGRSRRATPTSSPMGSRAASGRR